MKLKLFVCSSPTLFLSQEPKPQIRLRTSLRTIQTVGSTIQLLGIGIPTTLFQSRPEDPVYYPMPGTEVSIESMYRFSIHFALKIRIICRRMPSAGCGEATPISNHRERLAVDSKHFYHSQRALCAVSLGSTLWLHYQSNPKVIPCTVPTEIYVIEVKGLKMHNAVRLTKHCQHDASYTHGPAHGFSINKGTETNLEGNRIK